MNRVAKAARLVSASFITIKKDVLGRPVTFSRARFCTACST